MKPLISAAIAAIALALPALSQPAVAQERFTATVTGAENAPAVILIPGLASSGAVWDDTVKQLADTHSVHVLQVRGFAGEAAGVNAEGPILQPLIDEIASYAARLNKPALIGHSIGGLISLEVAAKTPDAVGRVMAVDALPFYSLLFNPAATVDLAKPFAEMNRSRILGVTDAEFAAAQSQTIAAMAIDANTHATLYDWTVASDRRVVAQVMYEVMIEDARPLIPAITAPVTVLYAWDASMNQPTTMADGIFKGAYAGQPAAQLKRIDGSYHFIMIDQPELFAAEVARFLSEPTKASAHDIDVAGR